MLAIRSASERGHADHGWLDSWHSFSFADYHDPAHMGFGPLRVINDDFIAPGMGFGTHGHRDMEIITYVLDGEITHKDSMGNGEAGKGASGVVRPGDVQRMTAGTGVLHSEYNRQPTKPTRLLQIWIIPERRDLEPGYEQRNFDAADKRGRLRLVASRDGADGSVLLHQDVKLYAGLFDGAERATLDIAPGRLVYVHVARGEVTVNGTPLREGDALKMRDEAAVEIDAGQNAEVLVFNLPH